MKVFRVVVRALVWLLFAAALYFAPAAMVKFGLKVCDTVLILALLFVLTLGVTFSLAYTYDMDGVNDAQLKKAIRLQQTFLHASQCWNITSIFMAFVPLYTTCAVIYLSPDAAENSMRILVYSILSLVFSMGVYIVRPQTRSTAYRNGYILLKDATLACELELKAGGGGAPLSASAMQQLRESIKKAEEINADYYNQSQT